MSANDSLVDLKKLPKLLKNFIEVAKKDVNQARKKHDKGDGFDLSTFVATFTIDAATIGRCLEYRFSCKDPKPGSVGGASNTGSADDNVRGTEPAAHAKDWSIFLEDLEPAEFRHHNCRVYLLNLQAIPDLWNTEKVRISNA